MAVTAATLRTVFGIIGNVISLCLFLSPAPTFYNVWKWKSTREYSGIPYVATLLNCMLWVFYGIPIVHPNSILVVTINGTGVFLEGIYVMMFVIYCSKDTRVNMLKILALVALLFALFVVLTLMLAHTHDRRSLIVGFLCVVFGTCMYAAPLSVIDMFDTWTQSPHCQTVPCWRLCRLLSQYNDRKVVSSKSVKYMPLPLSLASFLNGTVWMAYACIHFDIFITIPNGLGACLSGLQLMLYAKYYRTTVWEDDKEVTMKVEASA